MNKHYKSNIVTSFPKSHYDDLAARNTYNNRVNGITLTHARGILKGKVKRNPAYYGVELVDETHFKLERTGNTLYPL